MFISPWDCKEISMAPSWFHILSIVFLCLGFVSAIVVAAGVLRHPQHIWIMNLVWPVTALFGTIWIIWQYFKYGTLATHERAHSAMKRGDEPPNKRFTPFGIMVSNGTLHCGSGCTLGDICAEWLAFGVPAVAVAFGWGSIFGEKIFAVWILDYLFAYLFGSFFNILRLHQCAACYWGKACWQRSRRTPFRPVPGRLECMSLWLWLISRSSGTASVQDCKQTALSCGL
jgi:Domain of unknown function (DUF4396)